MDTALTDVVNVAIVALLTVALKIGGKVEIQPTWVVISVALYACYSAALAKGHYVVPISTIYPDASWNWGGKVLAITFWLMALFILVKLKRDFRPSDAGFTLKQNAASIKPATIALGLFVLLQILLSHLSGMAGEYDAEELLFQATMPGFDEEPMYRGLLLYSLSLALQSQRTAIFGAQINVAGLMLVALFGLAHGLRNYDGEWYFSPFSIAITGLYGFVLLWFREKTGSLVFPVIAHNAVNFIGQFKFI